MLFSLAFQARTAKNPRNKSGRIVDITRIGVRSDLFFTAAAVCRRGIS